ncbi:hypothetical protein F4811DRAFT_401146 [Daldinia bambusicola]|nr:hypothetical protein F4811DRAFT_401146 [Daldinia bambusicola]
MKSSSSGSSSKPQLAFSHSNGRKTSTTDPYGDNLPGSSGTNATPDKKHNEKTRGNDGSCSAGKENSCHKVAQHAWHKMESLFKDVVGPVSGKTKRNDEMMKDTSFVMLSEARRSNRGAGNSSSLTSGPQPQPQTGTGHERIRTQTWLQRYKTRFGSQRDKPAPRDPYDNGFLSAPSSTPSRHNTNDEEPRKKTPSPGTWFAGLL